MEYKKRYGVKLKESCHIQEVFNSLDWYLDAEGYPFQSHGNHVKRKTCLKEKPEPKCKAKGIATCEVWIILELGP